MKEHGSIVTVEEVEPSTLARKWAVTVNGVDVGTVAVDVHILQRDGLGAAVREIGRYLSDFRG